MRSPFSFFFFFNDTATTEIYTLSLHDALPISQLFNVVRGQMSLVGPRPPLSYELDAYDHWRFDRLKVLPGDRKSTRLNSSHGYISYAVFCLKKKKNAHTSQARQLSRQQALAQY